MGVNWLTRGKKNTSVKYGDEFISLTKLAYKTPNKIEGVVDYKGKEAYLFVGEAEVEPRFQ